jgi:AraC family transcriptional regulator
MNLGSERQYSSYFDYARRGYVAHWVVENRLVGSQGISLLQTLQQTGDASDPPIPDLMVSMKRRGFVKGTIDIGAGKFHTDTSPNKAFIVVPPHTRMMSFLEGQYELNAVAIPGSWARSLLSSHYTGKSLDFGKLHSGLVQDKIVSNLVEQFHHKETLESNNALLVDGLAMALLGRLATLADRYAKPRPIRSLDKVLLAQVEDFLHNHLADNPTMDDLARLTGMSVDHFGRCFKQATGHTPYHYVLEKRLKRAKQLLEDSRLSLVEVALTVGFVSQAHMNKMFKQRFAVTPGAYRKSLT